MPMWTHFKDQEELSSVIQGAESAFWVFLNSILLVRAERSQTCGQELWEIFIQSKDFSIFIIFTESIIKLIVLTVSSITK